VSLWRCALGASALFLVACGAAPDTRAERPPAPAAARTPLAPARPVGRDLRADERAGGHTLARHVARTDDELRSRLARERGVSAASTWNDEPTAARVIQSILDRAGRRVDRWAERAGPRPNLALDGRGTETIGRSLARGAPAPVPVACAVVVLRWDAAREDYYVLTSYPEACR